MRNHVAMGRAMAGYRRAVELIHQLDAFEQSDKTLLAIAEQAEAEMAAARHELIRAIAGTPRDRSAA